jgi:hypothetical protein
VVEPLLDNPRSVTAKVAAVLGGTAVKRPQLTGFLNSEFDPFLNQVFAASSVTPREAAEALDGHPGFVWLAEEPRRGEIGAPGAESLLLVVMHGMTAATGGPAAAPQIEGGIVEVRSPASFAPGMRSTARCSAVTSGRVRVGAGSRHARSGWGSLVVAVVGAGG